MADALIVSGSGTGVAVDPDDLARVRAASPDTPILIGSGLDLERAREWAGSFDGAIVGTALKSSGSVDGPVEVARVAALREALSE